MMLFLFHHPSNSRLRVPHSRLFHPSSHRHFFCFAFASLWGNPEHKLLLSPRRFAQPSGSRSQLARSALNRFASIAAVTMDALLNRLQFRSDFYGQTGRAGFFNPRPDRIPLSPSSFTLRRSRSEAAQIWSMDVTGCFFRWLFFLHF